MPHMHHQWSSRDLQSREDQGVNRRAFVQGDRPLARCCTTLGSALAVRLKRHTGDSNVRNNMGVKKKKFMTHFSQSQLLKVKLDLNFTIRNIRENIYNNLKFYFKI